MSRVLALATAATAAILFTTGCSEYDLNDNPRAVPAAPPDIVVDPVSLQFGALADGETEIQKFRVTNVGEGPLTIDAISIVSGLSFTIVTENLETVLEPTESKIVEVQFQPFQGNANYGQAVVVSDDPDTPEVFVDLMGTGLVPELKITPDVYDFGSLYVPCGDAIDLTFENVGYEDLVIDSFDYVSGGALSFTHNLSLPLTLAPGEQAVGRVAFDGNDVGTDYGQLDVFSNDPRGVVSASQQGAADVEGQVSDVFQVPVNPPVDILFAVDQSCSMDTEAAALAAAFSDFISTINSVTQGWQIGVVTHDHGCFNGGVLTQTTPNYQSIFQQAVSDGNQEVWSEALLALSDIALSQTGAGGCNAGFLRPGAMLHLILVSDEPEQSGTDWATWVNTLQGYASPGMFKISSIVDLGGCGLGPNGYDDAALATGGEILNICNSSWSSQVSVLASASLTGLNTYNLSDTPIPSSITVTVDGQVWTSGWTYDYVNNAVVFNNPQFQGGETIEIDYDILSSCP